MLVLIKGMEMPKSCKECRLYEKWDIDGFCWGLNKWFEKDEDYWNFTIYPNVPEPYTTERYKDCPLVEAEPTSKGALAWCINCGYVQKPFKHCPNCGERMKEKE